jgi:integrase
MMMLARCGMRINEPLRLCRHHYRPMRAVCILRTKFRKDRLIPLPKALLVELDNYLAARNACCPDDQNPYCWQAETVNRSRRIMSVGSFIAPLKISA